MSDHIWIDHYKITSYLVNLRGQAGLYAILNLIQDVGWMHALHLKVKLDKNEGWVFTRQKLTMQEWPAWNQTVTVRTWIRPPSHEAFLYRDYEIYVGKKKLGECTSTFTVMDMNTRKLAVKDWSAYSHIWKPEGHLPHMPEKIVFTSDSESLSQFQVRNSDIDLNNHVNNTKYAQWILDAIPIDMLRGGVHLYGYEVNFLAEAKTGDVVNVQKGLGEIKDGVFKYNQFQGVRTSDQKPIFTARLKFSEVF